MSARVRDAVGWALVVTQFALLATLASELRHARRTRARQRAAGLCIAASGAVAAVVAARTLGRELRAHPAPAAAATLRTDGPYRFVRHPIYSGLLLGACGLALAASTARALATLCALAALLSVKARFEERLLAARFPAYAAYAQRTPRFVPRRAPTLALTRRLRRARYADAPPASA